MGQKNFKTRWANAKRAYDSPFALVLTIPLYLGTAILFPCAGVRGGGGIYKRVKII